MRGIIIIDLQCTTSKLTYVCESTRRSFAKLFGFIRQRYFHDAGYGPGRCLHLYGVWSQQLQGNTVIVLNLRARNTRTHNNIYIQSFVFIITSLQTRLLPKTTCNPSKKLSPNIVTEAPPWVHPSLGVMCFIHGVATGRGENIPKR